MHIFSRRDAVRAGVAASAAPLLGAMDEGARIGNGSLYAIGVVTPNGRETAQHYQRVLGISAGELSDVLPRLGGLPAGGAPPRPVRPSGGGGSGGGGVVEPNGRTVGFKMNVALLRDFYVKIFEPLTDNGPYAAHLRKYGLSIQDCQIHTPGDMKAIRASLVQKGGRWVLGSELDPWAYIDFREMLGTTLEPINQKNRFPFTVAPGATTPLGSMPVTHVGFAVRDARRAARAYSDVFGIPMPELSVVRHLGYPPGSNWNKAAYLRVARWKQGDIGMELVESVGGPTPWSEFVRKFKGNAASYISFDVGDRLQETVRDLQAKGGKWVYGGTGGSEALFDFTDVLGLAIKVVGSSKLA